MLYPYAANRHLSQARIVHQTDIRILHPASNQAVNPGEALIGAAPPGCVVSLCLDYHRQLFIHADERGQWRFQPFFPAGQHSVSARIHERGGNSAFVTYTVRN